MSNHRHAAMARALEVARHVADVCKVRDIPIPEFEISVSEFANADAEVKVIWHPSPDGDPIDRALLTEAFALPRWTDTGFNQSTWGITSITFDEVLVEFTQYTR